MSDLTRISERLASLETKADLRDEQLKSMDTKLDELVAVFHQAKGAKYVVFGIAAFAGVLTTFLTKLIPFSNGLPR